MPPKRTFTLEDLSINIPKIFEQVQNTSANHQKNYVALYKLHLEAAKEVQSVQNGASIKLVGERAFEDTFISMFSRALPVKKGAGVADRIVRFVGGYIRFINEKGQSRVSSSCYDLDGPCSHRGTPKESSGRRRRGRGRRRSRCAFHNAPTAFPAQGMYGERQDCSLSCRSMHLGDDRSSRRA